MMMGELGAIGGVEADCEIHLRLQSGVSGFVELSKTRRLRNSFIINGQRAMLEVGIGFNSPVHLKVESQDMVFTSSSRLESQDEETFIEICWRQLEDFGDSILNDGQPFVSGHEGMQAVELIESCYASRQLLKQPWLLLDTPGHGGLA